MSDQATQLTDTATPQVSVRRTDKYSMLLKKCELLPSIKCGVVHPCDRDSLLGAIEAAKLGLIDPVLIGPEAKSGPSPRPKGSISRPTGSCRLNTAMLRRKRL